MNPERWRQVERLYYAALEREPDERAAFLESACADDESLRREVASLVVAGDRIGSFMEPPVDERATVATGATQLRSMIGEQLGHYRILLLLGKGGMGEVYLCEDTNLGRKVALKLLPAAFTSDRERLRRFEREARTASALNHPNIITIYEIGQAGSTHYLVTEYIEGETLRQRIEREPLSFSNTLDIAVQVASALAAAHAAGITHRDIKPENVMVRPDGLVKVLDFGLAKLTRMRNTESGMRNEEAEMLAQTPRDIQHSAFSHPHSTAPGMLMGTVSYMSPEQARGLKADHRTDIFSLGVMLYELVAGRRPFEGATASDVIAEILRSEPPPVSQLKPSLPAELKRMIGRMLAKEREERYQSASELLVDLRDLQRGSESNVVGVEPAAGEVVISRIRRRKIAFGGFALAVLALVGVGIYRLSGPGKAIDSLVVLPFANGNADPQAEYMNDGITESLINNLSQLPNLRVIARTTAFRYKGREGDPQAVGHELHVRAVLTGRVVQRGDTLIVQADLVDVADGSQLWGQQYNRKLADIFAVQEEISREITEKLRLRLSSSEQKQLTKRYTENTEAYQLYLKGRYYWNRRTTDSLNKGIEYFRQATYKDPNYALAYAGLADSYSILGSAIGGLSPRETFPKAKAAALKAQELDDTLAEAHAALALVRMRYDWDWPATEREIKRAIELNPNYATTYHWYSDYLEIMGRPDEAIAEIKRAENLDPLSLIINSIVGLRLYRARRYDQAIEQCQKTLEMDPNFAQAHLFLGWSYEQKARSEEAIATLRKAVTLSPDSPFNISALGHAYAVSGQAGEAMKILDQLRELSRRRYISPHEMAIIYAGLGEKEQAFAWLEKAYADRSWRLPNLKVDPRFDSLRSDPRFTDLVRRVGLA